MTCPRVIDRRVLPQASHVSSVPGQSGRSRWQTGQISASRPPATPRIHGRSRLSGS